MKIKHLLVGMLAIAAAAACKPDAPVEEQTKLEVAPTAVSVAATAGESSFNVTSNKSWSATADADWVSLEPASGEPSDNAVAVKVTAEDNEATEARTATVTVTAGELTMTVEVTQAAAEAVTPEPPGPDQPDPDQPDPDQPDPDQPDPDQPDPDQPSDVIEITATSLDGTYFGDDYTDAFNYYICISDLPLDEYGNNANGGHYFSIDLYSEIGLGGDQTTIPYGEYTFDVMDTFEAGTFSAYYSNVTIGGPTYEETEQYFFTSGKAIISEAGIDLTVEADNGKSYHVVYTGSLEFGGSAGIGTLTGDLSVHADNGYFIAINYGDFYGIGKQNTIISLYSEGETMSGDSFMFEILHDDAADITGTFYVLDPDTFVAGNLYNCFWPGEYEIDGGYFYPYGSWYMTCEEGYMDGMAYAPLLDGTISIMKNDDGTYLFNFTCYDDHDNMVSGSITAAGEIIDAEGNPITYRKSGSASRKITKTGMSFQPKSLAVKRF